MSGSTETTAREAGTRHSSVPDWVHLGEGERVVWHGRPSIRAVFPAFLPGTAVFLAGIALILVPDFAAAAPPWLVPLGAVVVLAGLGLALLRYVRWQYVHYVVTTNEVYKKRGLVSREVEQLRLVRVENVSHSQSGLQRVLGYGDVVISTEGSSSEFVLDDVPNPTEVHKRLSAQFDGMNRGST
ncbi:PH domain-containing protein [Halobium salinum]|uniref:PH domain-containing protein n=1 Tax=Halobium salinum TaxID=1364940 RepID=A0ABD5P726_9EURY|nr:PH domain-containing protein [Halobium salinum]